MAKSFLSTETPTLESLFATNKTYVVPKYQRNYSWNTEQWEDLWLDIEELENSNYPHFMGSIVLQELDEKKEINIIDGQQRLTTLSILIIAAISCIDDLIKAEQDVENNKQRIDIHNAKYIGYKNPNTLNFVLKLRLNNINDRFFADYIVKREKPNKATLSNEDNSNKLMLQAFNFFKEKLTNRFKNLGGGEIGIFIENIQDQLKFIQITVQNELDAYTLFQTLNARGVELSPADLLKNYLFNILSSDSNELELADSRWRDLNSKIDTKTLPDYIRYIVNSQNNLVRKNRLFKEIKNKITDLKEASYFIERLNKNADLYLALQDPNHNYWIDFGNSKKVKNYIKLLKIFNVKLPIPLLITVENKFEEKEFEQILKACVVLSIRYALTQTRTNTLEVVYNRLSCDIFSEKINSVNETIKELKKYDIDDVEFKKSLMLYSQNISSSSGKKIVKPLLSSIERHLNGGICDEDSATIEHILPLGMQDGSYSFTNQEHSQFVHKLGNYVLLEEELNKEIKNKPYNEKIKIYAKSKYKLAKYVADNYDLWDKVKLDNYQRFLANQINAIWSF